MRLDRLHIMEFQGIHESEKEFPGQMTVIDEAGGGRRWLDAVQIAAGTFLNQMPCCAKCGFHRADGPDAELTAAFTIPAMESPVEIRRKAFSDKEGALRTTVKDAAILKEHALRCRRGEYDESAVLPLFAFNDAERQWGWETMQGDENWMRMTRLAVYSDGSFPDAPVRMFAQWFTDLWYSMNDQRIKKAKGSILYDSRRLAGYENLRKAVGEAVDACLEPAGVGRLDFDIESKNLCVRLNGRRMNVVDVGGDAGAVLGTVADLACRCCILNRGQEYGALAATPGIVLLDWRKLCAGWPPQTLAAMRRTFPSLQFIVVLPHGLAEMCGGAGA